jgi:hypothetical protein
MPQVLARLVATFLIAASPAAAQEIAFFPDVPRSHWAHEAVYRVTQAGLIEGRPDGTFGGARPVTRYEFAVVMARMFARTGATRLDKVASFPDVPREHWAVSALSDANRYGVFQELPGGKFRGDLALTRYSSALAFENFLLRIEEDALNPLPRDVNGRLLKKLEIKPGSALQIAEEFPDVEPEHWAYNPLLRLYVTGILEGTSGGRFHGERPLTRYEMVIAVARLLENPVLTTAH